MIEYLLGVMTVLVFVLILTIVWLVFFKVKKDKNELSVEEQDNEKRLQKHYANMMNFSFEKAIGGKNG